LASWLPKWILAAFVVLSAGWAIAVISVTSSLNFIEAMLLALGPVGVAYVWLRDYYRDEQGARRLVVYLAMTDQQLICLALKKDGQPGRVVFNAPLLAVQIKYVHRPLPSWSFVQYRGPGVTSAALRLFSVRDQRDEMTNLLRALQSAGIKIDGLPAAAYVDG
jgi:hypothetical protein